VLQFDWEMTINKEDRNVEFLEATVRKIYEGLVNVEKEMAK
jgi:aspartate--ammonia ligase